MRLSRIFSTSKISTSSTGSCLMTTFLWIDDRRRLILATKFVSLKRKSYFFFCLEISFAFLNHQYVGEQLTQIDSILL